MEAWEHGRRRLEPHLEPRPVLPHLQRGRKAGHTVGRFPQREVQDDDRSFELRLQRIEAWQTERGSEPGARIPKPARAACLREVAVVSRAIEVAYARLRAGGSS
jgi:hypothetical protein